MQRGPCVGHSFPWPINQAEQSEVQWRTQTRPWPLNLEHFRPSYKSNMLRANHFPPQLCWQQCPFFAFRLNLGVLNLFWLSWFCHQKIPWFILFHLDTKNVRFGAFLTIWQPFEVLAWRRLSMQLHEGSRTWSPFFAFRLNLGVLNVLWLSWFCHQKIPWFIFFHLDTKNVRFGAFLTKILVKDVMGESLSNLTLLAA